MGEDGVDTKLFGGFEIGDVEGDDEGRGRRQGGLEHHVVLGVRQERPPKEMDTLIDAKLANSVEKGVELR